jgi:hypothetical protein
MKSQQRTWANVTQLGPVVGLAKGALTPDKAIRHNS